ncbi:MAG: hypothetical protein M3291_05995 [Actinomycetota bacterium]|nr:hypothetical protein [Actinomycetota bacterium]
MSEPDPLARWRQLPDPVRPEDYVTEQDDDPVPGSVLFGQESEFDIAARYGG